MAREFKEKSHLNIDAKKYATNHEKIFGKITDCWCCKAEKVKCKLHIDVFLCVNLCWDSRK